LKVQEPLAYSVSLLLRYCFSLSVSLLSSCLARAYAEREFRVHKLLICISLYCLVGFNMRRSKLEMYIDILKVLARKGPLKLTHVMYKANLNCGVLKDNLEFLIKQGLVEERIVPKRRVVYAVTPRGITVLRYFKELKQVLPIVEEAQNGMSTPY
jgi:predicted transcriptional regulator